MTQTTLNQSPVIVQTFMGALYSSQYYAADTGSVNAIIIPLAIAPNAYAEGIIWFTKFANTNTSQTVTAKVGSLAALPVVIDQAGTLPPIGSIVSGMFGMLCYSTSQNKLILLNPSKAFGSFTLTLTGMASGGTGTVNYEVLPDGNIVYAYVKSNITGVSNATTMTGTGVPVSIATNWANAAMAGNIVLQDNSGPVVGCISSGLSTTTWTFGKNQVYSAGGFTGSANKGIIAGTSFSYPIN